MKVSCAFFFWCLGILLVTGVSARGLDNIEEILDAYLAADDAKLEDLYRRTFGDDLRNTDQADDHLDDLTEDDDEQLRRALDDLEQYSFDERELPIGLDDDDLDDLLDMYLSERGVYDPDDTEGQMVGKRKLAGWLKRWLKKWLPKIWNATKAELIKLFRKLLPKIMAGAKRYVCRNVCPNAKPLIREVCSSVLHC